MLFKNKTDYLIESIRKGRAMTRREKLNLIVGLSVPSMLAQISTVMMFFIDASMVGHPVSYTHLTLPTTAIVCRSRWSPYH